MRFDPITGDPIDPTTGLPYQGPPPPMQPGDQIEYEGLDKDLFPKIDVEPKITPDQARQRFESDTRPDYSVGNIIGKVLTSPIRAISGLEQEFKGMLGLPTIEDYAADYRNQLGIDDGQVDIGDRMWGSLTGSSRDEERAGLMLRRRILENAYQRKQGLGEIKTRQEIFGNAAE